MTRPSLSRPVLPAVRRRGAPLGLALAAALAAAPLAAAPLAAQRTASPEPRLADDLTYLADARFEGRLTGSPGADSAAAYLVRRFQQIGLQPAADGWYQEFEVSRSAPTAQSARVGGLRGRNVIAILPGRDPALRNQTLVIGAHYDHLGTGHFGSLDPDSVGKVHNGADDNASGTAALLHIARQLVAAPPARTVVFIAFSGEELGLLGSAAYVKHPAYALDRTIAMINLDMVGRLRNDRLIVMGTGTAKEFPALLDSLNWYAAFDLKMQPDGWGRSDQSSFLAAKLPVLFLFTDLHEDYHRTTDDVEKINLDGLKRVVDFTVGLASALGNRRTPLSFVDLPPPRPTATASAAPTPHASGAEGDPHGGGQTAPAAGTGGYGAYLGSIPDMSENPGGVRLTGVRSGSPAERAGLKAGDVIVRIGRLPVPDLQAMTDALRAHRPGDTVEIVYLRDGARTTTRATLGTRGG